MVKVVFFGTPAFAVPTLRHLLDSPHAVVGVVTQPDRPRGRGQRVSDSPVKSLAVQHGLPVLQPDTLRDPAFIEVLRAWQPDLGVVAAYGKLLPDALLTLPPLGMINVHASLLPKYRGAAPVHRAVIAGERETGVTIMRVERELDAGPMLATAVRPIAPDETSVAVEQGLAELGAGLLVDVVQQLADGTAREQPQDASQATYAAKITRADGEIDWSQPWEAIHNQVRGLYPWPHAYTTLDGARLIVLETQGSDGGQNGVRTGSEHPHGATQVAPGTIVEVTRDVLHVATGRGRLAILRVQPEGKRPMAARDFLAGRKVQPGTILT